MAQWDVRFLYTGGAFISYFNHACSEKDIDEVLQTDRIFMSVSLGEFAKKNDLKEAFNNTNEPEICVQILKLGEMQISEKERSKQNEALFHKIASVVVEKCVDSNTKLPLTVAMVERAIKGLKHRFDMNKSAKQQALKIIPLLADQFPIERAKMLIRVVVALEHAEAVKSQLLALMAKVMHEIQKGPYVLVGIIEPARYRDVDQVIKTVGTLEVLNPRVTGGV